jgi:hypothetical protein
MRPRCENAKKKPKNQNPTRNLHNLELLEIVVALYSKCSSKAKVPVCLYVKLKNCKEKRGCAGEDKVQRVFFQGRNWISRERPWRLVYVTIRGNTWR